MDTVEKIEEYLESLEEFFFSSLSAVTTDLPNIQDAVNKLWLDISRYGPPIPSFPEMHIPVLGDFQVPPPPLPQHPPPQLNWLSRSADWTSRHPWIVSGIALGVVGASLTVGYRNVHAKRRNHHRLKVQVNERRQVVVVLGGDDPLALPLILSLEAKGYIVIASVSNLEAGVTLEQQCQGYVRALVLDSHEPATVSTFLGSLTSTLSRKFPFTASGDPYASPFSQPYIQSVICLLTLSASVPSIYAPLEHISLRDTYLSYLNAVHITPLQVLQGLLPLLRTGPARARDKGKKTIIVCLPAIEASVGLPFTSVQSMSTASTLRGIEVLRREINLTAFADGSESMKNIKVVTVNVGALDIGTHVESLLQTEGHISMEHWTPAERAIYGPALISFSSAPHASPSPWMMCALFRHDLHNILRKPSDVHVFVDSIISVVTGGRHRAPLYGLGHGLERLWNWIRGDTFSVGAGAKTYWVASQLPSSLLETLLNIPYFLISVRNRLLPPQPFIRPEPNQIHFPPLIPQMTAIADPNDEDETGHDSLDASETSSEPDIESNASEAGDSTWIRLRRSHDSVPEP